MKPQVFFKWLKENAFGQREFPAANFKDLCPKISFNWHRLVSFPRRRSFLTKVDQPGAPVKLDGKISDR